MPRFFVALVLLAALAVAPHQRPVPSSSPSWRLTGRMHVPRDADTATLLLNGTVLVAGGYSNNLTTAALASAEVYNPRTGTWALTGHLHDARFAHQAILLRTGKVLVVGGVDAAHQPLRGAELYDPRTGRWTATGSLATARAEFAIALLPNGDVLVAGGVTLPHRVLASAEVYHPRTGQWTATGSMHTPRYIPTATTLLNGTVLVTGGRSTVSNALTGTLASAELYHPRTGTWTVTGSMTGARYDDTATRLPNGDVLVAGTAALSLKVIPLPIHEPDAEIYDPRAGIWTPTGSMITNRGNHAATLLHDGTVLVVGGSCSGPDVPSCPDIVSAAEVYHPGSGRWTPAGRLHSARLTPTATTLPDGSVLVAGGLGVDDTILASAEIYK